MKEVQFLFDIDQQVVTPFGGIGIISMMGVDDGGITYYVKTESSSNWFKESQLKVSPLFVARPTANGASFPI